MQRKWQAFRSLTIASLKMYFRNTSAVFFTLVIPIFLVVIFGVLNNGDGSGSIHIAVTNKSTTEVAKNFEASLKSVKTLKIDDSNEADARDQLGKGKIDLQVVIPEDFGATSVNGLKSGAIQAYYNQGKPQTGQTAGLIINQVVSQFNAKVTNAPQVYVFKSEGVKTNNLGYIDYLLPGIIAMTIMQLGIFSVAFAFISFKTSGALRRMQATPLHPINFIAAQSVTRIIIGVMQVCILLGIGVFAFNMHLIGSLFNMIIMSLIGIITFLAFGFGIAGWAKDENQAAPVANLISFPMLFLSGTFFPREAFPETLKRITDVLPLTFLADGLRRIANEGATLWTVRGDILGLAIWALIAFVIAIRVFKWE